MIGIVGNKFQALFRVHISIVFHIGLFAMDLTFFACGLAMLKQKSI